MSQGTILPTEKPLGKLTKPLQETFVFFRELQQNQFCCQVSQNPVWLRTSQEFSVLSLGGPEVSIIDLDPNTHTERAKLLESLGSEFRSWTYHMLLGDLGQALWPP